MSILNEPLDLVVILLLISLGVWLFVRFRRNRQPYERLFFENPNPMWIFDAETLSFLEVNQAAQDVYGYSNEEFLQMTIRDLRPNDEVARLEEHLQGMKATSLEPGQIWVHRKNGGRTFYVRIFSHTIAFRGRNARMVLSLDVNEQFATEERAQKLTQELAQKNRYLESLLNSQGTFAVIRIDLEGKFTYANEAFFRRYGYHSEELLGHHIVTVLNHDDLIALMEAMKRCKAQPGKNFYAELRLLHRETLKEYEVEFELVAITNEDGQVIEIQGIGQDGTEKAAYQRQITEFSRQQENIMSSIRDVVWSVRISDGAIQYMSPSSEEVYGYTPDDFRANPALTNTLVHPDDRPGMAGEVKKILEAGSGNLECRIKRPDGSIRYILSRVAVAADDQNRPATLNGVATDVTSLKVAEQKASDYSRQLSEVLESITDGFFAMDKHWNLIYLNREFEKANSVRREDLLGKNLWEEFPVLVGKTLWHEYNRAMLEQVTVQFEEYYDYVDRWYLITAYPNPEGLAIYFSDITDRKRSGQIILEQNKKLREIAWIQSHKVRAPVARILGLIQIYNRAEPGDPNNLELLRMIEQETLGLDATIGEVVRKSNEVESMKEQV